MDFSANFEIMTTERLFLVILIVIAYFHSTASMIFNLYEIYHRFLGLKCFPLTRFPFFAQCLKKLSYTLQIFWCINPHRWGMGGHMHRNIDAIPQHP